MISPARFQTGSALLLALIGGLLSVTPAPAGATLLPESANAPSSLQITSRARSSLALSWKAASGAAAYRVKYARSASFKAAKYLVVPGTSAELTELAPSRTYYVKVRSVTAGNRALSRYSGVAKGKTRSSAGYPFLRPIGVTAPTVKATSAVLTWAARGGGLTYRVRYDTDSRFGSPRYAVMHGTSVTLTGLLANVRYHIGVGVVSTSNKTKRSEYSATVAVRTPTRAAPLRVATYNVKCHNCYRGALGEHTWLERRAAVTSLIRKQAPDVLSLQEAQQSRIRNPDGSLSKVAQMEDLVKRLGKPYRLVNPYRYNCVKSTSLTRCVPRDREASRGIRLVYNTAELVLTRYGAKRLSYVSKDDMERYVSWAVFHQIDSGKDFMVADVHLENTDDLLPTSTAYYNLRKTQTRESLAEVNAHNPGGLPVIFAGDFNSTKFDVPTNAPYDIMRAAGYVDPLGNTYRSTTIASWATAEKRIHAEYNSYNRWLPSPPKSSHPNGSYFDYIFTSSPMRVSEWETAMTLNPDGSYAGIIPSDHHLLRATVWLP